ncbi:MAG: hypothetical protein LBM93_15230 [Oscillospiraceae bacterium]|jgi:hypothetical protein|nr:hypothetical protein [Oscillospiraceae bacterium]MDR0920578.1 hypothetical protein [Oscillospiraceae bacterium]
MCNRLHTECCYKCEKKSECPYYINEDTAFMITLGAIGLILLIALI